MWRWAREVSRTRRARKAAVTAIAPIVEGSRYRLGGIPDLAWSDPYIIGFIVMLISIIARVESGRIAGNSLNLVQRGAWEDITAMTSDAMAEDLLVFAKDGNRDFELGCRNAATFSSILFGAQSLVDGVGMNCAEQVRDPFEADFAQSHAQREDVSSAWRQFFDAHISESSSQGEPHQFDWL